MLKFKKNDKVIILTGKDKKKISIIKKVIKKNNNIYLLLDNINLSKKHVKSNPNKNQTGGIINITKPIAYSNVMLLNNITNKKDKTNFIITEKKKFRLFKSNKEILN